MLLTGLCIKKQQTTLFHLTDDPFSFYGKHRYRIVFSYITSIQSAGINPVASGCASVILQHIFLRKKPVVDNKHRIAAIIHSDLRHAAVRFHAHKLFPGICYRSEICPQCTVFHILIRILPVIDPAFPRSVQPVLHSRNLRQFLRNRTASVQCDISFQNLFSSVRFFLLRRDCFLPDGSRLFAHRRNSFLFAGYILCPTTNKETCQ